MFLRWCCCWYVGGGTTAASDNQRMQHLKQRKTGQWNQVDSVGATACNNQPNKVQWHGKRPQHDERPMRQVEV
jgi:hypothetical protein